MWSRFFISSALLCAILHTPNFVVSHPADEASNRKYADLNANALKIFGKRDNATGERLAKYNPEVDTVNPEELGSYFQGDIVMTLAQARNAKLNPSAHWPNAIVPYVISGNFDATQKNLITKAIAEYTAKTCIRFVARTNQPDYISITSEATGCWSYIGKIGGKQQVNLQAPGCVTKIGTVIHELLHSLGLFHEHARSQSIYWIDVQWQNIEAGAEKNFEILTWRNETDSFLVPYDYSSVMHYSPTAFSKNGLPTIVAQNNDANAAKMGQRDGFSANDVKKLNIMYKC